MTTTLPHCGQLLYQARLYWSSLNFWFLCVGSLKWFLQVGMQISYYGSEAGHLASDASCNSYWNSPTQTEAHPHIPLFWLQRLFWVILNNSGQNKNISEILHNCHHLPWKGPFHKTLSIYLHVWNKRATGPLGRAFMHARWSAPLDIDEY